MKKTKYFAIYKAVEEKWYYPAGIKKTRDWFLKLEIYDQLHRLEKRFLIEVPDVKTFEEKFLKEINNIPYNTK